MLKSVIFEFEYCRDKIKLETGFLARQSTTSILASIKDTVILVTLVTNENNIQENPSFLPLNINYQEKFYSVGKIPGGFFRREGRHNDYEIIKSRLIDRSIRPLFDKFFFNNVQITINVISLDKRISTDIISIIAVSAALSISNIPFNGPLGVSKVSYSFINNKYIINPNIEELKNSMLDLVISGTENGITMIDSSSKEIKEEKIFEAINLGYKNLQIVIENINIFKEKVHKKITYNKYIINGNLNLSEDILKIINHYKYDIKKIYNIKNKVKRSKELNIIYNKIYFDLESKNIVFYKYLIVNEILNIEKEILINKLEKYNLRIDDRKPEEIRNIDIKIGFLPSNVHGSSIFTRGETQSLATVTLGTYKDAQNFDDVFLGEYTDRFIFHYNFPSFSVGEIGSNINSPKRREIGHGYLAKKSLIPVIPDINKFSYTIRIVSDILGSNGSSSMASVCSASLALMNAGVPIKSHVSGISMGLIKTNKKNYILSDIVGDEDKIGDMDFKIAGTIKGITSLQMDMKTNGINCNLVCLSLKKSIYGRLFILDKMNNVINKPNTKISPYAPRIYKIKIDKTKISRVIGKRGCVIKSLTENNNCSIDIEDNGLIKISSFSKKDAENVINSIKKITFSDIKEGYIYNVKITKITNFGIFVSFLEHKNKSSLVHISQIHLKKKNIFNIFKIGEYISVKVIEIDKNKKIKLTMKNL